MRCLPAIKRYRLSLRAVMIAISAVWLCVRSASAVDDYATWGNWRYVYLITDASGAKVTTADVYNVPVLVRINPSNFDGLGTASDAGADIRFSKTDGTHLYYQIERWVHTSATNDTAEIWVLVDTIKANDTTKLIMFWNWGSAVDSQQPTKVFDTANGFAGVYHMKQASGSATEATISALNGTANGGVTYARPGIIGYAGGFDGNGDYFDMGNNARFQMDAADKVTVSAWVNRAGAAVAGAEDGIVGKYEWTAGNYREYCLVNKNTTNNFQFFVSSTGAAGTETYVAATGVTTTNGIWYYVVGTMDASATAKQIIYVNGALQNSTNTLTAIYGSANATCKIGLMDDNGGAVRQYWNGTIDEVRVERVARSPEWIKLCYQNQRLTGGRDSLVWFSSSSCAPARYTWDNSTGAGYSASSNTWSTTDAYWSQTGTSLVAWAGPSNTADFAGSDGNWTVTVSGTQYVDSISFQNSGYKVTGGTSLYVAKKLSGKVFGFSPPYAAGSDSAKAFDGTIITFCDDNAATGGFTGIDLGSGNAERIAYIRYYPRASFLARMNGGKFQGSNDGAAYTDLYTIGADPTLAWQTVAVSNTTAWRYLRYYGPTNGYCNVTEIEFYGMGSMYVASGKYDTIATVLAGNGGERIYGASDGYLTFSGSNTYAGPTEIYSGCLQATALANGGSNSSIGSSSNAAANLVFGGGTLRFTGASSQSTDRAFTINSAGGTIDASGTSTNTLTMSGASTIVGGSPTLTLTGLNTSANTLSGQHAGALTIAKSGTGMWTLSNANNTYTGGTNLTAGTLNINSTKAIGAAAARFTISGSTAFNNTSGGDIVLANNNPQTWNGDFTFTGTWNLDMGTGAVTLGATVQVTVSAKTLTVGGAITGSYGLTKAGAGTLLLSGTSNAWTGATTISAGTLQFGAAGVIPDGASAGNVSLTGTLNLGSYSESINGLSGAGTVTASSGTPTLTVGSNNQTSTFSGVIQNGGGTTALTKTGTGTLTMSNTSTYTGATTVGAGTLLVTGATNASSAVGVSSAATLGGTGTINGAITLNSGSTLAPGTGGTSIGTLTMAGITFNATSTYSVDLNGTGPTQDSIYSTGTVALGTNVNTLTVASLANSTNGKVYTIIAAASVTGYFSGKPDGTYFVVSGRTLRINYPGNTKVTLTDMTPSWSQTGLGTINGGSIGETKIFLGTSTPNAVIGRNLTDGSSAWSYTTGITSGCGTPTYSYISGAYVIVAASGSNVVGVNDNGTTHFAATGIGGAAGTPYICPDNTNFFVTRPGFLSKRLLSDGSKVAGWDVAVTNISTAADIVVFSDFVYVATTDGKVQRADVTDFTPLTTYAPTSGPENLTGVSINLPLMISNNTLYITPNNNTLHAVSTSAMTTNKTIITYSNGSANSGPAFSERDLTQDTVYTAAGVYVYMIKDMAGGQKWAFTAAGTVNSGPLACNNSVYFGANGGYYYAVNKANGVVRANWPYNAVSGNAMSGPWIDVTNTRVIFGSTGGDLHAFVLEP